MTRAIRNNDKSGVDFSMNLEMKPFSTKNQENFNIMNATNISREIRWR
jgi:hypothetical protein